MPGRRGARPREPCPSRFPPSRRRSASSSHSGPGGIQRDMGAYHPGEIEVQRLAGVRAEAEGVGRIIADTIPEDLAPLLAQFRLAVAASIDARGRVWASLLTGPDGFLKVADETRLRIDAHVAAADPLRTNLLSRPELGLLVIDPATRRRLRFNGVATLEPNGGVSLAVEQVYGNCRKYIQARHLEAMDPPPNGTHGSMRARAEMGARPSGATPIHSSVLGAAQQAWIGAADTFFIASAHPEGGADASHRGGRPGFVRVDGDRSLSFPDYAGNNMFNTLGNLAADPRAGLLFVDFERGDLVQVTGRARLDWEPRMAAAHRGANQVVVHYDVDEVIATPGGSPLRWRLVEPSPYNP